MFNIFRDMVLVEIQYRLGPLGKVFFSNRFQTDIVSGIFVIMFNNISLEAAEISFLQ